jgi:predicted kinase
MAKNSKTKIALITAGHTAAGKTTLGRAISEKFNIQYVSEGEIKRGLVENYTAKNSLDEKLRDKGYAMASQKAIEHLLESDTVLVDASFHKRIRRVAIESEIRKQIDNVVVVWLYCDCSDYSKVEKRISRRAELPKSADTQADSIAIYSHILNNFDIFDIRHFSGNTVITSVDTNYNKLRKIESNFNFLSLKSPLLTGIFAFIDTYLDKKRSKNE